MPAPEISAKTHAHALPTPSYSNQSLSHKGPPKHNAFVLEHLFGVVNAPSDAAAMKPPAYVSIVLPPSVRIESLDAAAKASLAGVGLTIQRDSLLFPAVHFSDCPGELLSNDSFVDTFTRLNNAGIAFGEDYKQGWAPADIMRALQSRGRITAPFTAIAWRGPDDWFTTVYECQPTNAS